MNNMNIDNNSMENIKNMIDNGNLQDVMSQISPEMIENFNKMLSNNQNGSENAEQNSSKEPKENSSSDTQTSNNTSFNLNGVDMKTVMKLSSAFNKMNSNKDDSRVNLLNSLKPYLRENKKGKLDNYMNLLNVSKLTEVLKENKENK